MDGANRPLSPHLQAYGWFITNTLSILHRLTGLALTVAAFGLVIWLMAAASGSASYERAFAFFSSVPVRLALAAIVFCFFFHLANGIRHLFWDAGIGFAREQIRVSGWSVVALAGVAALLYVLVVIV